VGHVDLAPTFCKIAGLKVPDWMQGNPLPTSQGGEHSECVLTTFDSQFSAVGMHLRTIYKGGFICTVYEASTVSQGGKFPVYWRLWGRESEVPQFEGGEGELYDCNADPKQFHNLWNDPERQVLRRELVEELYAQLPAAREPALVPIAPT
jgi:arylsulfatase A-like enzyme